jgi:NhaP-type Na+/H+ or K+/H+ antiporter
MWSALVYLNLYDLITTAVLLEHEGKELNPITNHFVTWFGITGLIYIKVVVLLFLTLVTGWIADNMLILRQQIVVVVSYLIAISYYSYMMYNYNYTYMKSFGV